MAWIAGMLRITGLDVSLLLSPVLSGLVNWDVKLWHLWARCTETLRCIDAAERRWSKLRAILDQMENDGVFRRVLKP